MILDALRRVVAVLLGDDPLRGYAGAARRHRPALTDVTALDPRMRNELIERARSSGLLIGGFASVISLGWALADRLLEPELSALFLTVRLFCVVPMTAAVCALWSAPVGRRRPELLTFLVLCVVQVEVAWMIPQVHHVEYYLMGFTLAIYASACLLESRPRWTAALVGSSWVALVFFVLTAPDPMTAGELGGTTAYVATASVIGLIAHLRRHLLAVRELLTRARLEHEQERTRGLLAQLERLSHEDPLTGLANRRRWDAELSVVCAAARKSGEVVSLVLLDLDHFKQINDRHGHAAGDEALRAVAQLLRGRVRDGDLVARLGGDEIGVLLPGTDLERAAGLAEQLRREAALLAPAGVAPGELTLSLGVATGSGARAYPLELISCADAQLYCAKITRNAVGRSTAEPVHAGRPADPRVAEPAR
jgi:diguanylate cyclase (GGDEF)-like protein